MAIRIKARGGESSEQLMRRFKKLCEKEGLIKELKKRAHYEKPSERRRRDDRKKLNRMRAITLGLPPRGPRGERAEGGRSAGPGGARSGPPRTGGPRSRG